MSTDKDLERLLAKPLLQPPAGFSERIERKVEQLSRHRELQQHSRQTPAISKWQVVVLLAGGSAGFVQSLVYVFGLWAASVAG